MAYDFSNLTVNQRTLLTFDGWQVGSRMVQQPSSRTVKKLLERGLIVELKRSRNGLSYSEFSVPTDVHAAWCEHCSRQRCGEVV
jgi:hypothetical protein